MLPSFVILPARWLKKRTSGASMSLDGDVFMALRLYLKQYSIWIKINKNVEIKIVVGTGHMVKCIDK